MKLPQFLVPLLDAQIVGKNAGQHSTQPYDPAMDSEEAGDLAEKPPMWRLGQDARVTSTRRLWIMSSSAGIIIAGLLVALIVAKQPRAAGVILHCGSSPPEARSRGCEFSLMDGHWIPSLCYDRELDENWSRKGWRYWEDKNGTKELTQELIKTGDLSSFWVTTDYHRKHCQVGFNQLGNRYMEGTAVPSYILGEFHFRHCLGMMTRDFSDTGEGDVISTRYDIEFSGCASR